MPKNNLEDKENRINNHSYNKSRRASKVSKRRALITKKRKSKRVIIIFILSIFIFTLLFLFYFVSENSSNSNHVSAIDRYYNNSDYSNKYNQFNANLYFNKYKYEEGNYYLLDNVNWEIKNKYSGNFEYYLWDNIQAYLNEKKLSQEDFSLSIKKNKEYILSLNSDILHNIDIVEIPYLLMIRDGIENNIIDLDDSIALIRSDLDNSSNLYDENSIEYKYNIEKIIRDSINLKDSASISMLNRYLSSKNLSVGNYLSEKLGKTDDKNYSTSDMVKLIELYDNSNSIINSLFNNIFNNSDDLFTNSIYSNVGNISKSKNSDNLKYEMGIANSDTKFYYAIYSEKLSQEQIQEIGDIVNRTISEINLIRSIQN